MYTIKREIGRLDNFKIGLVGDLANGRTARSLAYVLAMYPNVKIYFVAPDVVRMKDDIKDHLTTHGIEWEEVCHRNKSTLRPRAGCILVLLFG